MIMRLIITALFMSFMIPLGTVWAATESVTDWAPQATYQITADVPDAAFQEMEYKNYSGPIDGLTSKSEGWTGFFRQGGRTLSVDLGQPKPISQISLEFRQDSKMGVYLPPYLDVHISNNGKSWSRLGRLHHAVPASEPQINRNFSLIFPEVSARYVKIDFPVDVWTFARHLVIAGPASAEGQPFALAHQANSAPTGKPFLQIPGMEDILLVYTGALEEKGRWSASDFSPVVAYSKGGVVEEKMFDTVLFLPYAQVPTTKEGWSSYAADLFAKDIQLDALNQAAGKLQGEFGPDYKEKVILTLPYPDPKQENFGAIEEGGSSLSFSAEKVGSQLALQNRIRAIHWFHQLLKTKWGEAQFEHLELAGIYWYKETIDPTISEDVALVKNSAAIVHEGGLPFFWIPYYGSVGYDQWKEYGFDYAIIQPNYYANQAPPVERMNNVHDAAQKSNMAIEIELDEKVTWSRYYYDLFYKQLDKGHELGLDGAMTNAYYAGAKTMVLLAGSEVPEARKLYDDLYKWISGQYEGKKAE